MKISHHALLYRSDSVSSLELPEINEGTEMVNSFIERFGVDDARELIRQASNRPLEADLQLLVVRTNFITLEAQNALLKVLEDPPDSTHFVFVLPHDLTVLPTLDSRFSHCTQTKTNEEEVGGENKYFKNFLKEDYKDRIRNIEQSLKNKDIEWQRALKQGLIQYIKHETMASAISLKELEFIARLLLTRGASNKLLLEHMAMVLPVR